MHRNIQKKLGFDLDKLISHSNKLINYEILK